MAIRTQQDEIVLETELNEQCINSSNLDFVPAARVADFSGFDVIFAVWLQ